MLERVKAGVDVLAEREPGGVSRWQPLKPRQIEPQFAEALSAFRARRSQANMQLAGRALLIETAWTADAPEIASPWCVTMRIDRTNAELVLPQTLLDLICRHVDPSVAATALRLDHAALLLEFALSGALEAIEAALGCAISLTSAGKGSGQLNNARDAFVPVALQLQGAGTFRCQLRLEPPYLLALAHYLDRISGTAEHRIDMPVPVHLRWAMTELSLAELRGLAPGDIILVDYSCRQPGTAIAVFGDHLLAPVELLRTGYRFSGQPRLAQRSGWEWAIDRDLVNAEGKHEGSIGDVPVRLFFELGQLVIDRGALSHLKPGEVMGLARPLEEGIDIVVDGARIGHGQITTIGDAVGIRVTRI
jgi:type III secretion protein Q